MAIPSGSGTEVIKSTEITALTNSVQTLITGVANHIYTVLSIIVCEANDDSGKLIKLYFADSDGSTNPVFLLRGQPVGANETFVFNDKFSFMGTCPTDWGTNAMNTVANQDAIAEQGSTNLQSLQIKANHANDQVHVMCSFIDQNNS